MCKHKYCLSNEETTKHCISCGKEICNSCKHPDDPLVHYKCDPSPSLPPRKKKKGGLLNPRPVARPSTHNRAYTRGRSSPPPR